MQSVVIIGAGLAGVEAAWAIANSGVHVELYEAKPKFFSPAHRSENFAELVCSNSLKSEIEGDASALLKEEMRALGSLVIEAANATRVPAGKALAVDREGFSKYITEKICTHPNIEVVREEVKTIESVNFVGEPLCGLPDLGGDGTPPLQSGKNIILATGPLTSPALSESLAEILRSSAFGGLPQDDKQLYFYDAIAPIVETDSIDMSNAFRASRYGVGKDPLGDYINCPLNEDEYYKFIDALLTAQKISPHEFDTLKLFEGCQPIETMAMREKDFPRHGPMKPVGLTFPRTGKMSYAVVQLRQDDLHATLYNIVGFQTRMTYGEQDRVFRMIPALRLAKFARYGSMHRNTFINSPLLLDKSLQFKAHPGIFVAGQLTGVEGYMESAATGLYAGIMCMHKKTGQIPPTTALGALINHITWANSDDYQPMGIIWGIFPPLLEHPKTSRGPRKKERRKLYLERARRDFDAWLSGNHLKLLNNFT